MADQIPFGSILHPRGSNIERAQQLLAHSRARLRRIARAAADSAELTAALSSQLSSILQSARTAGRSLGILNDIQHAVGSLQDILSRSLDSDDPAQAAAPISQLADEQILNPRPIPLKIGSQTFTLNTLPLSPGQLGSSSGLGSLATLPSDPAQAKRVISAALSELQRFASDVQRLQDAVSPALDRLMVSLENFIASQMGLRGSQQLIEATRGDILSDVSAALRAQTEGGTPYGALDALT